MGDQTTVTVGVDSHADVHVAAVLDQTGRLLDTRSFATTTRGYARLATWAESFGQRKPEQLPDRLEQQQGQQLHRVPQPEEGQQ